MGRVGAAACFLLVMPFLAGCAQEPQTPAHVRDLEAFVATLDAAWRDMDAACSTDAPYGLGYLLISQEIERRVKAADFTDPVFMAAWTAWFGTYYLTALTHRADPAAASAPWREAFEWGDSNRSTVLEDFVLAVVAHVRYDLALSTYDMGVVAQGRRADFDELGALFEATLPTMMEEIGRRYDETLRPGPLTNWTRPVILRFVVDDWRDVAWEGAVRLTEAANATERAEIRQDLAQDQADFARVFQVPKPQTREDRLQECERLRAAASPG